MVSRQASKCADHSRAIASRVTKLAPTFLLAGTPAAPVSLINKVQSLILVCGEPCDIQVCTICATEEQLEQTCDFVMQATLRQVIEEDPTCRLIALECGHIFTVDTLDGTLDMSKCYTKDQTNSQWLGLAQPDGFQTRINCPHCRGPINAHRYNRPMKRALLDLREQVAILRYASEINNASSQLTALDDDETSDRACNILHTLPVIKPRSKLQRKQMLDTMSHLDSNDTKCIEPSHFECHSAGIFGVEGAAGEAWRDAVSPHLDIYRRMANIVNSNRMPHFLAYEGAISSIYFQELELAGASKVSITRDSKPAALRMARRRVGVPPPGGQMRFTIQALHETIYARLKMAEVATNMCDYLWDGRHLQSLGAYAQVQALKDSNAARNVGRLDSNGFKGLSTGLLVSCKRDCELAIRLAYEGKLSRLVLDSHILALQVAYNDIRHTVKYSLRQAENSPPAQRAAKLQTATERMVARCLTSLDQAAHKFNQAISQLNRDNPHNPTLAKYLVERRHFAETVLTDWHNYARKVDQRLSLEETRTIVRAVLEKEWGE
jgi:hypothetical protein